MNKETQNILLYTLYDIPKYPAVREHSKLIQSLAKKYLYNYARFYHSYGDGYVYLGYKDEEYQQYSWGRIKIGVLINADIGIHSRKLVQAFIEKFDIPIKLK